MFEIGGIIHRLVMLRGVRQFEVLGAGIRNIIRRKHSGVTDRKTLPF